MSMKEARTARVIQRPFRPICILFFDILPSLLMKASRPPFIRNWLCYYGTNSGPDSYARFELVVLDGKYHPPLSRNREGLPIILGYVSLAEVEEGGHLWPRAKDGPFLIKKNPIWGSWVVDVRDEAWQAILLEQVIPEILAQGFDGLMLDTADSALDLGRTDQTGRYRGTGEALVSFIRKMPEIFPGLKLALNRGLEMLPLLADRVDYLIVENLYSYYDRRTEGYRRVGIQSQALLLEQIREGLKVKPELVILTLDYAAPQQRLLINEAIAFSRERGFVPYVATQFLDQIQVFTLDH